MTVQASINTDRFLFITLFFFLSHFSRFSPSSMSSAIGKIQHSFFESVGWGIRTWFRGCENETKKIGKKKNALKGGKGEGGEKGCSKYHGKQHDKKNEKNHN